jgi:hypothetical protein
MAATGGALCRLANGSQTMLSTEFSKGSRRGGNPSLVQVGISKAKVLPEDTKAYQDKRN